MDIQRCGWIAESFVKIGKSALTQLQKSTVKHHRKKSSGIASKSLHNLSDFDIREIYLTSKVFF